MHNHLKTLNYEIVFRWDIAIEFGIPACVV